MMLNSEIVDTVKDWQDTENLTLFCTNLGQIIKGVPAPSSWVFTFLITGTVISTT